MELVFGAGKIDRQVNDAESLLRDWGVKEKDWGQLYLEYEPITPKDQVLVEDLAVTMLINSRVRGEVATSVCRNAAGLDLRSLPDKPLEETNDSERQAVADVIGTMVSWPWVGASTATKTLHKKRPKLIPILDNMAIFGAYMNPLWPERRALEETIKSVPRIKEALDWIAHDLIRPENASVWPRLERSSQSVPGSTCSTWSGGCTSPRVEPVPRTARQGARRKFDPGLRPRSATGRRSRPRPR
jgi:hypothetical protein